MTNGDEVGRRWGPPPHYTSHKLIMTNGDGWVAVGVLLIAHLTNQVDCSSAVHSPTPDDQWGWGGLGVLLLIAHLTNQVDNKISNLSFVIMFL